MTSEQVSHRSVGSVLLELRSTQDAIAAEDQFGYTDLSFDAGEGALEPKNRITPVPPRKHEPALEREVGGKPVVVVHASDRAPVVPPAAQKQQGVSRKHGRAQLVHL